MKVKNLKIQVVNIFVMYYVLWCIWAIPTYRVMIVYQFCDAFPIVETLIQQRKQLEQIHRVSWLSHVI